MADSWYFLIRRMVDRPSTLEQESRILTKRNYFVGKHALIPLLIHIAAFSKLLGNHVCLFRLYRFPLICFLEQISTRWVRLLRTRSSVPEFDPRYYKKLEGDSKIRMVSGSVTSFLAGVVRMLWTICLLVGRSRACSSARAVTQEEHEELGMPSLCQARIPVHPC